MMEPSLIALTVSALVYAVSLALMHMPLKQLRAWGWQGFMHSVTSVALVSVIAGLTVVRELLAPYIQQYVGVDVAVGPEAALAHIKQYQSLVMKWVTTVNLAAQALGAMQALIMLALTPALVSGVGVLYASIATYIFTAVFGGLIFMQRVFSFLFLFGEVVKAFISIVPVAGPGMFAGGLILYSTPFARRLGKTLIVLGAALTLALPPIVVAALPSPDKAEEEIAKTREIQAYSIALDTVNKINAGARINILDRNGTIQHIGGGRSFHESRMVNYPYFKLELEGSEGSPPLFVNCSSLPPGVPCEAVAEAVAEMLKQPESGFINSEQEFIEEGYRTTLTMLEPAGRGKRAGTYLPDTWLLGLWLYMQGDSGKRDEPVRIRGKELDLEPPSMEELVCNDITCWWEERDIYEAWKEEWEKYWQSTPQKALYAENMVQEGYNTSLIWFTKRPVGSEQPLNLFVIYPGVQSLECRITSSYQEGNETKYRYGIFVQTAEEPITYFAYLEGAEYQVQSDTPGVEIREVNASELVGRVVKDAGPLSLEPSIPATGNSTPPSLEAAPPARCMMVYFPGGEFQMGGGGTCEEAYLQYLQTMMDDLMLDDNSTNPYVNDYRRCFEEEISRVRQHLSTGNESGNHTDTEIIPEPDGTNSTTTRMNGPPCVEAGGVMPISILVEFRLIEESPLAPWKPSVEWEKFDKDEEYMAMLASGEIVSESGLKTSIETHREEWDDYPIFRQGLYRDSPAHYGQRLVVQKLLEYRSMSWTDSSIALMVYQTFKESAEKSSKTSPVGGVPIPSIEILLSGEEGVGILDPLSKLVGHTIALGIGLLIFAIATDAISGLIGGESAAKAMLASSMAALVKAFQRGGVVTSTARASAKVNTTEKLVNWLRDRRMYKSAADERRKDRETHDRVVSSYIERRKLLGGLSRLRSRVNERLLDKKEELEDRGGVLNKLGAYALGSLTKKYLLDIHKHGLLTDPDYARRFVDQAAYLRQMRPAGMTPERWAEGVAYMIKNAPSRLEKLALIDKLARDTSIGRNILLKGALGGLAEEVSWLTRGRVNIPVSREIKAPAAFAVAADRSKPLVDELGGRRPDIPVATVTRFRTGLVTRGLDKAEPPYIHNREPSETSFKESLKEIRESVGFYDRYVRPLSPEEKTKLSKTLISNMEVPRIDGDIPGPEYAEVELRPVDSRLEPTPLSLASPSDVKKLPVDDVLTARITRDTIEFRETHEGIIYEGIQHRILSRGHDYGPELPGDVQRSFPWASGDAVDRMAADGYSFSKAWENISGEGVSGSEPRDSGSGWWISMDSDASSTQEPSKKESKSSGWWI